MGFSLAWLFRRRSEENRDPFADLPAGETSLSQPDLRGPGRCKAQWPVSVATPNGARLGATGDISSGGLFVKVEPPLELGQAYRLTIAAPAGRNIRVEVRAVWSIAAGEDENREVLGTGVVFTEISEEDQLFLRALGGSIG